MYIPLHHPWSLEQGSKKRTASGTVRNSVKLLLLDQALVLHWWMGWAQLFVCHCLCMTWFLVHPLTSPYMVYLLRIIDVLIFSVRFSVVGGKIQFQFCAHVSGTPTNSYSTWIWHEYRPVLDWTDLHLGQSSLAKSEACELFAQSCHPQNSTNAVLQLIVQKFGEVWFKVWWFKVLTHYLHLSALFYGGLWFLCIQGGDIFGFLFTINRINRIQR